MAYLGDMGSYDKAKELFLLIKEHFEHIDVLVNNAGISYIGLLTDMAPEDWNKIITTNQPPSIIAAPLPFQIWLSKNTERLLIYPPSGEMSVLPAK